MAPTQSDVQIATKKVENEQMADFWKKNPFYITEDLNLKVFLFSVSVARPYSVRAELNPTVFSFL